VALVRVWLELDMATGDKARPVPLVEVDAVWAATGRTGYQRPYSRPG